MGALALFADTTTRGNPLHKPEILWGTLGLAAALLVGAAVIYIVDRWRKRAAQTGTDDVGSLTSFRAMYENGEITEAEYTELRRKLADRVKKAPAPAGAAPAAASAPPAPPVPGERQTVNPPAPPAPTSQQPPAGTTPPA